MSAYGMTLTVLCTQLAEAVAADEKPESADGTEGGGCDLSAGLYGPALSEWLRTLAEQLSGEKRP